MPIAVGTPVGCLVDGHMLSTTAPVKGKGDGVSLRIYHLNNLNTRDLSSLIPTRLKKEVLAFSVFPSKQKRAGIQQQGLAGRPRTMRKRERDRAIVDCCMDMQTQQWIQMDSNQDQTHQSRNYQISGGKKITMI